MAKKTVKKAVKKTAAKSAAKTKSQVKAKAKSKPKSKPKVAAKKVAVKIPAAPVKKTNDAGRKFAIAAAQLANDSNAEEIVILDLQGISPVADYFVIATGTSSRQMRAVADDLIDMGKADGNNVWQVAGLEAGDWIVLDFVDVVVHLFSPTHRKYYDLEMIWGDCPRVEWQRAQKTK